MPVLHGFELIRDEFVAEYRLQARLYRHVKTGAELLSIINDDPNKVFGITFRTPPGDSTGVAHILEHSVLCGSKKFPVKEPFVELLKGSLQTFLNAFTYPDKTCYPVASQNLKDFYNLVDIYVDAALHPLLEPATFDQEAWHYEIENPDAPLIYKGVVFNEMKGVYASADSLLAEHSQRVLYPDITYGLDYGGDPRCIPDLTWEQLRAFHRRFYHPSNARVYFYGDDDPVERLRRIDEAFRAFDREIIDASIPLQPASTKLPVRVTLPYPCGGSEDPLLHLTMNWRLPEGDDPERTLGLYLLDTILTDSPASPLRKALIESGLGEDLAGAGVETQIRELYFSTGMKGIRAGDEDRVVALIESTLRDLVANGIDPKTIEAALNTEEFNFRELNTGSYPRGLSLMVASLQTWLYEGDPLAPLRYSAPLAAIRARLAAGERYFENLIQAWLIENPHRTQLLLVPDPELKNRLNDEEAARLANVKARWTGDQLQQAISHTRALKARQATPDTPEALRCIPSLSRADLEPRHQPIPIEAASVSGTPVLFHDLFTQGITYLDLGLNLEVVPDAWLGLVPVWARALLETGTDREDFVALSQRIGRLTGGIEPDYFTSARADGPGGVNWLFLRGKAVDERLPDLLRILTEVIGGARLDRRDRIRQIVAEEKAEIESNMIPAGHRFVAQRLRARFLEADWVHEHITGVSYLFSLRALLTEIDRDWEAVRNRLRDLHRLLTARSNLLINITAERATRSATEPALAAFLNTWPGAASADRAVRAFIPSPHEPAEGLIIPAQVNYVGKSINLHQGDRRVDGHALVVNRYVRSAWLWDQVRVQGGAYGGFSMVDSRSGQCVFSSYRDPNLIKTLQVYDRTAEYLAAIHLDDEEVTRAVIGAIGDLDAYLLPDAKGYLSLGRHLVGDSDANRQRIRDEVLRTGLPHFHAYGALLQPLHEHGHVVVMGSRENLAALADARITPVL